MVQHSPMSNESDFFRQRGSPHAVEDLRVWCPEVERNYLKGDGGFESSEINRIETFVVPREWILMIWLLTFPLVPLAGSHLCSRVKCFDCWITKKSGADICGLRSELDFGLSQFGFVHNEHCHSKHHAWMFLNDIQRLFRWHHAHYKTASEGWLGSNSLCLSVMAWHEFMTIISWSDTVTIITDKNIVWSDNPPHAIQGLHPPTRSML